VSFGSFEKINGHGINQGKIPGSFAGCGGIEFGDAQPWVGQPWNVADVICFKIVQSFENVVVD
jgi:hypothetical protein